MVACSPWIRHLCRSIPGLCTRIERFGTVYQHHRKWKVVGIFESDWTPSLCPRSAIASGLTKRCLPYFYTATVIICKSRMEQSASNK